MTLRVDDFKAKLKGGGARPNLFRVLLNFPAYAGGDAELASFMCKTAQLPASNVASVDVPFRGRVLKIAGERTFDDWGVTIINDTDFSVRDAMERWMNGINDLVENTGVSTPAEYSADLFVEQLDRDDTVLKTYIFRNAHPLTLAQVDVAYESTNALEEFEVTWRYQHFEASGVNF